MIIVVSIVVPLSFFCIIFTVFDGPIMSDAVLPFPVLLTTNVAVVVSFMLILENQKTEQQHKQVKQFAAMMIFRKFISIGEDGEEHYDVIDMEIEAQRGVRRITDHQEIVKQYQKVVRAYNNFMKDYPWKSTGGLMQDNCRFGDMLKAEKRKSQSKHELGRLMGEYEVPLTFGQFQHA